MMTKDTYGARAEETYDSLDIIFFKTSHIAVVDFTIKYEQEERRDFFLESKFWESQEETPWTKTDREDN